MNSTSNNSGIENGYQKKARTGTNDSPMRNVVHVRPCMGNAKHFFPAGEDRVASYRSKEVVSHEAS